MDGISSFVMVTWRNYKTRTERRRNSSSIEAAVLTTTLTTLIRIRCEVGKQGLALATASVG